VLSMRSRVLLVIRPRDLSVVEHVSGRVGSMYLRKPVETAPSREIYRYPRCLHTPARGLTSP
jgi:ABC-type oligopeptide transport system ATPase subunit